MRRYTPVTIDTMTAEQLRIEYREVLARQLAQRDDARLGWWVRTQAVTATLTTQHGKTITAPAAELLAAIDRYLEAASKDAAWRAS